MRFDRLAISIAAALLIACAPLPAGSPEREAAVTSGGAAGSLAPAPEPVKGGQVGLARDDRNEAARETGYILISVRWPRSVQAIPLSSDRIDLSVAQESGAELASASLVPTGEAISSASIQVPARQNLTVTARALDSALVEIASGSATASILPNEISAVTLTMTAKYIPTVVTFPANAGPGAIIEIFGSNFGKSRNVQTPKIMFGTVAAPGVYTSTDASLSAEVPAGLTGTVSITVVADGVPSAASGSFRLLTALNDPSPKAPTLGTVGATMALSITATSVVGAESNPTVSWVQFTPPLAPIPVSLSSNKGSTIILTALRSGTSKVIAISGSLKSTADVTVP